jgi:acyl-CoA dehydrogenase
MCTRVSSRKAFGKPLSEQTVTLERIAESRVRIDQARLLVLDAARQIDGADNKQAAPAISAIKIAAPAMACQVIDWAIQAHGGAGLCDDFGLAYAYAVARALRLADGPDEVHRNQLALMELKKQSRH